MPEKKVSPKLLPKKLQPKKSNTKKQAPKSWQLIAAVVAGVLLVGSGIGVGAFQIYTQTQLSAALKAENAIAAGSQRIEEVTSRLSDLELAVKNAMEVEVGSQGRTLDEKDREALAKEIEKAKQTWVEQKTKLLYLESAVDALKKLRGPDDTFTANVEPLVAEITKATEDNWQLIVTQVSTLGKLMGNVQTAQASWQQEQDRIAAEQAAAAAKAASDRLARQPTEPTSISISTPSTPTPNCTIRSVEEVPSKQLVANYIFDLAPNAVTTWVCGLCQPGRLCGLAYLPDLAAIFPGYEGLPRTEDEARVIVQLDENLVEIYLSPIGKSVLVHEAAHARQHVVYGTAIQSANEVYSGLLGDPAIEYMADCATIDKLGYSTGAYTSSCTAEQLSAAATIW